MIDEIFKEASYDKVIRDEDITFNRIFLNENILIPDDLDSSTNYFYQFFWQQYFWMKITPKQSK